MEKLILLNEKIAAMTLEELEALFRECHVNLEACTEYAILESILLEKTDPPFSF